MRKIFGKHTKTWKLNSFLLNNQLIKKEIKDEIKKCFQMNERVNTIYQNQLDTTKAIVREVYSKHFLHQKGKPIPTSQLITLIQKPRETRTNQK